MKYVFLALGLFVVFAACNKEPDPAAPTRENLLRGKKWKISGGTMTVKDPGGRDTALEYTKFIDTCYFDDYITFDSLDFGGLHSGDQKCNPADPDTRNFTWRVWGPDNSYIDLFNGFNTIFAVNTTIKPYHFDTLEQSPLKLDTIVGRLDTIPGFIKSFIVLDTIRELRFTSYKIPNFTIYGAELQDLTESSVKLKFSFKTTRLDSTNGHAGAPNNLEPFTVADTTDYLLTLTPM
ncbi:MAG: hypothetical protein KF744_17690 [Taibaiella sp.]|nr:hypothetical protein [Taibaiella sp.]